MLSFKNKLFKLLLIALAIVAFAIFFFRVPNDGYVDKLAPQTMYEDLRDLGSPPGAYPRYSSSYETGWFAWINGAETRYLSTHSIKQDYVCSIEKFNGQINAFEENTGRPAARPTLNSNDALGGGEVYLRISAEAKGGEYGLALNPEFTNQYIKRYGAANLFFPIAGGTERFICLEEVGIRLDRDVRGGELDNMHFFCRISFKPTTLELQIIDVDLFSGFVETVEKLNKSDASIYRGTCKEIGSPKR